MSEIEPRGIVLVRATVNLSGFPVGAIRAVDPDHPTVAALLDAEFLTIADETSGDEDE